MCRQLYSLRMMHGIHRSDDRNLIFAAGLEYGRDIARSTGEAQRDGHSHAGVETERGVRDLIARSASRSGVNDRLYP